MSAQKSAVTTAMCLGLLAGHCGSSQTPAPSQPQPAAVGTTTETVAATTAPPPPAPPEEPPAPVQQVACPQPGDADEASAHFEEGRKLLAESRVDEHYLAVPFEKSMAMLKSAAAKGHLEAQYKYGSVLFSTMFQAAAPTAKQEDDYVLALAYVRLAALRGHPSAKSYIEGLETLTVDGAGKVSKPIPEPLNALPVSWIKRVIEESNALAACP